MLNQPEPACLVIADISGYTELPRRRGARSRPGHPGRPREHGRRASARYSASPSSRATPRSPTRSPTRSTDRCSRTRSSTPTSRSSGGCATSARRRLRVQCLHPRPEPRPQGRRPPRAGHPAADRVVGGAARERRDRRPSAAEEPCRGGDRDRRVRALHRCLRDGHGSRRSGRGRHGPAPRGFEGVGEIGAWVVDLGRRGRRSWRGRGSPSSGPTRPSSTTRRSMRRRRSPGSTSPRRSGVPSGRRAWSRIGRRPARPAAGASVP